MEVDALIFPGSAESKEQFDIKNGVSLFCEDDLSSFEKKTSKSLAWSNWNHHQITCIKKINYYNVEWVDIVLLAQFSV